MNLDEALGIHAQALVWRARRMEVLASNLANAETPGYKARDLDFRAALAAARGAGGVQLAVRHPRHLRPAGSLAPVLRYRIPAQPALDGNTVDPDLEKAAFAENVVRYQASLRFVSGKIKGLLRAIKGE